jgi:hypothetical protein
VKSTLRNPRARLWLIGGAVFLILVGLLVWLGFSWLGTYRQAQLVQSDVTTLRTALTDRNWQDVPEQVRTVKASADELTTRSNDVPWRLLSGMPVVGASATALTDLSRALSGVAGAAEPLTPYAERLVNGQIRKPDGSIDLVAMQEVAPLLDRLAERMTSASVRLGGIEVSKIRPEIGSPLLQFRNEITDALPAVTAATEIATWMPGLLGADGERTWLVMLQNPAEMRGSGGLIGGFALMTARDGELDLVDTGTSSDLSQFRIPLDGAPADVRDTWGESLSNWASFNPSPHFPTTAALAAAGMQAMGQPIDGVIAVDPEAVAAMLQITGPVTAMGKTVTADDVARFFTVDAYSEYLDSQERDDVSMALVEATFEALLAANWRAEDLLDAMRRPVEERRVLAWSVDEAEADWLATTALGGWLPDEPGSVIAVTFNNLGGNKLDAFLTTEVDYEPGRCPTNSFQRSAVRVSMLNDPPAGLPDANYGFFDLQRVEVPDAPKGTNRLLVQVYAPVGANYQRSRLDGVDVPMYVGRERNRPMWWTNIDFAPGQERTLDVEFEEPTVLGVEPFVMRQPMVNQEIITIAPNRQC